MNLLGFFAIEGIPEDDTVVNGSSGHVVGVRDVDARHISSVAAVHLQVAQDFRPPIAAGPLHKRYFAIPQCGCYPEIGLFAEEC